MPRIILIETATALCSTALAEDGRIVACRRSDEPRAHAARTAPFIDEMLRERGLKVADCDAVCVSSGPGSYTGLRVGVSTAKGLCFGAGLPLLSVGTLEVLFHQALDGGLPEGCRAVVPMVDARRMECYTAVFAPDGTLLRPVQAEEIGPDSFSDLLSEGPVLFIGDGTDKCREALNHPNARFVQACPDAASMLRPAQRAWEEKRFEDLAYFEPFYLKEFVAILPKRPF